MSHPLREKELFLPHALQRAEVTGESMGRKSEDGHLSGSLEEKCRSSKPNAGRDMNLLYHLCLDCTYFLLTTSIYPEPFILTQSHFWLFVLP